ncbi:MAG: polyphosphate kinase 1 [Saprospiraceae bacterium]
MVFHDKTFFNRELSWLRFNHRVLQEAGDRRNPVYERLKFLAIFSSNLDEFFEVRVSNIRRIKQLDKLLRKKLITKPNKLLRKIKKEVFLQQEEFGKILKEQIIPDLKKEGISLLEQKEKKKKKKAFAKQYFEEKLKHQLSIQIDTEQRSEQKIFIEKEALYLVSVADSGNLIWVKIPIGTPRFVELPSGKGKHMITFVDDIINHGLTEYHASPFFSIKISRDAELYIGNEYSGNLLEKIKNSLSKRETGQFTRALVDSKMPESIVKKISQFLDINDTDLVTGGRYHNLKDFFGFPNPSDKMLALEKLSPKKQAVLAEAESLFRVIKEKDQLLYFPYESFDEVIRLVEEAATDENVTKIKMTLYRVSKNSAIAKALLQAVGNGKKVVVFIETKARFDEANNIKWGKKLEEAGAKVIYSYPGIKVHSKIMYIERMEENEKQGYGYIGTGNFNESTSLIYTDLAVMTAHPKITFELSQIFKVLEGKIIIPSTKKLLVSPFSARSTFIKLVQKEIKLAKAGKPAHILLKMNSLQDKAMIDLLYKASNAGVKIRLIVRGICCLVPGVEGQSENIYATSVVDRFLEHARVYIFGNGGKEKMYIGSADWMTRNLDHRIEVILPILDADIFKRIMASLQLQLDDDVKARILDMEQKNEYVVASSNQQSSQHLIYHSL